MAQELEQIVEMLREMNRANNNYSESFGKLLTNIGSRFETSDKNVVTSDLIKAYFEELLKSTDAKYTITLEKLKDIEKSVQNIFDEQDEHVKNKNFNKLVKTFSTNLNKFYSEAKKQKTLITAIENKVLDIQNASSDNSSVLSTITLLKNDFEKLNIEYKNSIDNINSDLKSILTNLIKSNQTSVNAQVIEQANILNNAIGDIVTYLTSIDERDTKLELLLSNIAANESLKITQGAIDSIIQKSKEISEKIKSFACKDDVENLETTNNENSKEILAAITTKAESLTILTDEIKQTLAKVSKDIDTIPTTTDLDKSLKELYGRLNEISNDINKTTTDDDLGLKSKIVELAEELITIKNILGDINEVVTLKVLTEINDLSFDKECYEIKEHVSKMLSLLPQKDDIDRLLENDELNRKAVAQLIEKTDEIEEMLDKLDFEEEFDNIYNKTSSIEQWLVNSKIKENAEIIETKIDNKAEQKEVLEILKTVENIVGEIGNLSKNADTKKINSTVTDIYQMIEELKTEIINSTEMQSDSIVFNLTELQKSIENIVTGEEFDNFVEDLKAFVVNTVSDGEENKNRFEQIKEYQENILTKLSELDTSNIEIALNSSVINIEDKLNSISDYLTDTNQSNIEEIKNAISEIKEILENKKSNFKEFENENRETFKTVENYLKEIKELLDTSDSSLSNEVRIKLDEIETSLQNCQTSNESTITAIIEKLDEYQSKIDINENQNIDFAPALAEITEIRNQIIELANSFKDLNSDNSEQLTSSTFVSEILNELGSNLEDLSGNIDAKLQHGFVYNAELIEEKTATIIDFIRELKNSNEQNSELYRKLEDADIKLDDYKQELQFINTDLTNSLGEQTENLLQELEPIKAMLKTLVSTPNAENNIVVKENLTDLHDSVIGDLVECTKYSRSTYDKLEDAYEKISRDLTDTQNNLKDFILSDIDSVIIKIDNLRDDLEENLNRISPPEAEQMAEFKKFIEQIAEFKGNPTALVAEAKNEIAEAVSEKILQQHEELKSMLAVSINNDEIIAAIEELKACFYSKIGDLSELKHNYENQTENSLEELEEFEANQFEKAFETDKNEEIISELKEDFERFSELIKDLSEENAEISEVLDAIRSKMETITVAPVVIDTDEPEQNNEIINSEEQISEEDFIIEEHANNGFEKLNTDKVKDLIESKVKEIIVGAGNFDFIKAFDLMKQDVQMLQEKVSQILSKEQQKEASTTLESIPTIPFDAGNNKLLEALDEKIELLSKTINPKEWLGEIKTYIAGDEIHSLLEEISGKIDILTLSDNSDMVNEIRDALNQLKDNDNSVTMDPQIQSMLSLINEKVDILAANDDYELIEEVRDAIDRLDENVNNNNILNTINSKLDVIAATDNIDDFEDIKESLNAIEEQIESVKELSDSDAKITSMLESLNAKIDTISVGEGTQQGIEDIKALIMAQTDFIENLEKNGKTEAVKKCLEKLTLEVNNLNTCDNTKQIKKSILEMKESIMAAIVTIFEQVSFVEESEDIKDFVEEKTDEINQNLATVTSQLKQITSSEDDSDYIYSMQDIESDLAKLRLALSNLQENEEESQTQRLTSIMENISSLGATVEELHNSIAKEDELKSKFERVSTDINSLSVITSSNFEDFEKLITDKLTTKVDKVEKLMETSHASDKVMRQALIYMGEWIDSASESMNKISTNAEEIVEIKSAIESMKQAVPEQTDILNSIEEKFDEQQERLAYFEKQIAKLGGLEDKFEAQQERIDRLEMSLEKILAAVEDIDDSKVSRKIDKIDKQIAKLSTNIEKLASYVD